MAGAAGGGTVGAVSILVFVLLAGAVLSFDALAACFVPRVARGAAVAVELVCELIHLTSLTVGVNELALTAVLSSVVEEHILVTGSAHTLV